MTEILKINANENEIEYAKFGNGKRAFVIIPGLSIKSVMESAALVENAYSVFKEDYMGYLFDRRKEVKAGLTVDEMAEDIADSLKALKIERAFVFGTSQGGMIAQLLAIKHPELVSKLVIASSASRLGESSKKVVSNWIDLAEKGEAVALCEDFVKLLYTDDFIKQYGAGIVKYHSSCTKEELERFIILAKACEGFDVYEKLSEIKCPVLVIGAENDRVLTPESSTEIAEKLGCECYIYPAPYSHAVYDEAPDYKERILSFFKNNNALLR